jgi:hypothetical protein
MYEELARLPTDLAAQVDHYVYGCKSAGHAAPVCGHILPDCSGIDGISGANGF